MLILKHGKNHPDWHDDFPCVGRGLFGPEYPDQGCGAKLQVARADLFHTSITVIEPMTGQTGTAEGAGYFCAECGTKNILGDGFDDLPTEEEWVAQAPTWYRELRDKPAPE